MTDTLFEAWLDTNHFFEGDHPSKWPTAELLNSSRALREIGATIEEVVQLLDRHRYVSLRLFEESGKYPLSVMSRLEWRGHTVYFLLDYVVVVRRLDNSIYRIAIEGLKHEDIFKEIMNFTYEW